MKRPTKQKRWQKRWTGILRFYGRDRLDIAVWDDGLLRLIQWVSKGRSAEYRVIITPAALELP